MLQGNRGGVKPPAFLISFFSSSSSDLHKEWEEGSAKFVVVVTLLVVSTLFYLMASLTDPGYAPRSPPKLYELSNESTAAQKVRICESFVSSPLNMPLQSLLGCIYCQQWPD